MSGQGRGVRIEAARQWVPRLLAACVVAPIAAGPGEPGSAARADAIVAYTIVNGAEIPESLTGAPGDPERGRALFLDQLATGCTACHSAPATVGPAGGYGTGGGAGTAAAEAEAIPLDGVGARLGAGALRLWLVDPSAIDPLTRMPGYYLPGQRVGIDDPLHNGPRLTASQIEDLVAWLATLDGR
jgi:sulfur-oxidizing protein SoxX